MCIGANRRKKVRVSRKYCPKTRVFPPNWKQPSPQILNPPWILENFDPIIKPEGLNISKRCTNFNIFVYFRYFVLPPPPTCPPPSLLLDLFRPLTPIAGPTTPVSLRRRLLAGLLSPTPGTPTNLARLSWSLSNPTSPRYAPRLSACVCHQLLGCRSLGSLAD